MAATDRRSLVRLRAHAALMDAARELVLEGGPGAITVDALTDRAGVARRTVFNHFATLDDVVIAVCQDAIATEVDSMIAALARTPTGDGSASSLFEETATALQKSDLSGAILTIVRFVGLPQQPGSRDALLLETVFVQLGERLRLELGHRRTTADELDVELLVASVVSGFLVVARRWLEETDGGTAHQARDTWDSMLARMLATVRAGYRSGRPA